MNHESKWQHQNKRFIEANMQMFRLVISNYSYKIFYYLTFKCLKASSTLVTSFTAYRASYESSV